MATVALVAVSAPGWLPRAHADGNHAQESKTSLAQLRAKADVAELDQLVAEFHRAASYGGDLDAMMALWADDSSLTFNGTAFTGTNGVRNYFANVAGPFKHYWVSLAPEFKTQFELRGKTASLYLECHFADPAVTPYVLRADIKVVGTVKKVHGEWLFQHLDLTTGATL